MDSVRCDSYRRKYVSTRCSASRNDSDWLYRALYICLWCGSFYILRLIAQGPKPYEDPADDNFYEHSVTESQGRTLSGDHEPIESTKEEVGTHTNDKDDEELR